MRRSRGTPVAGGLGELDRGPARPSERALAWMARATTAQQGPRPVVPGDHLAGHSLVEVEPAQLVGGRRRRRTGMRRWDQRTGHSELKAPGLHPPGRDPKRASISESSSPRST